MFKKLNGMQLFSRLRAYPIRKFVEHEDGAVSTDWVVLAALVVGICTAVLLSIGGGFTQASENLNEAFAAADPGETGTVAGQWAGSGQDDSGS